MPRSQEEIVESIQGMVSEQQYLLEVLALWKVATDATGLTPEDIKAFSFSPEFLSPPQKRRWRQQSVADKKTFGNSYHNCVRLLTGELREIPLTERPSWET